MARGALNWTVRDLAEAAGVHRNTISNIEVGRYAGDQKTLEAIEAAFKRAGILFIDENGGGPGVRLRKSSRRPSGNWAARFGCAALVSFGSPKPIGPIGLN